MYNGIGLLTVRGSGTSGYVQTNKFNLRNRAPISYNEELRDSKPETKQPDKTILEHNRKRAIEVKLAEIEAQLEDEGYVLSFPLLVWKNPSIPSVDGLNLFMFLIGVPRSK